MSSGGGEPEDDRGPELCIVLSVVLGTSWIFTLLRAYTRFFMVKNVAADDWWMFAAMITYTGYLFNGIYGILTGGAGQHVNQLTIEKIYVGLKGWYISEVLYGPVSAMVRTSVALFLLRVSVEPLHRWIIIVNLTVVWVTSFVFMFVATFQCNPPNYFYDQILGLQGQCMNAAIVPNVTIAHSVIEAVCDLVFAALPVAILWNVQLNKRTKVVIAFLLSMGSVAGIALFVRIPFIKVLAISPDFLYETVDVAIWSVLEPCLGIIAGCIATFRPLFQGMGFGRNTTNPHYRYTTSRRAPRGDPYSGDDGGSSSKRTWMLPSTTSGGGTAKRAEGGSLSPSTASTTPLPLAAQQDHPASGRGRWTWSSIPSEEGMEDMEMQAEVAARAESAVKTQIVGSREPCPESPTGDSGLLRGINVRTSIHTESHPVPAPPRPCKHQRRNRSTGAAGYL